MFAFNTSLMIYAILPKVFTHRSKSLNSGVPITSVGTSIKKPPSHADWMTGSHLCNKSSHEISLLLNITQSSSGGIITKWKWRQMSENFWWYSLSVQKFRDSQIIQRESLRQFENVRLCGLKNTLQCLCLWFWLFIYQLCVLSDQCREYTGTFFLVYAVSRKADLFKLVQHLILYNLGIKFLYWYIIEIEKWHNNRVTLSAKLQQG